MKKIISVLLAALMLVSCFGVASFAAGVCTCPDGVHVSTGYCRCCVYCPNVDANAVLGCYDPVEDKFCCSDCSGMYDAINGCGCSCSCCARGDQTGDENNPIEIVTPEQKENFVDGFQAIMKKISDFFDMIFDAIFEFLKIDGVIGKGETLPE